ncbi:MAG: 4Fe-4S binding protein [Candidatus Omnitrophota bacterium]|nr:4Fe-4S binding protein [Candidatus Omnitrophota bacterium]
MNKQELLYNSLKKYTLGQGADLFGVADISRIKDEFEIGKKVLEKLNRAVSLGAALNSSVLSEIETHPTKLYFHHYKTVNHFLDQLALKVSNYIVRKGYRALPIPASQITDWQRQSAHLSHKKVGELAGLGWLGRNNLLVNEKLGAQFRLVTILTDMPLKIDKPKDLACTGCASCVKVCPAGAIKKEPKDFDHIGCFEQLKEFQRKRLADQYICGICVKACSVEKDKKGR